MALFRPYARTLDAGDATLQRRASRTDLDFEAALLTEGTFKLREGLDVSQLGIDSPSPSPMRKTTPGTPVVVPPTPTPVAGPSRRPPSPLSDDDDDRNNANRRSMYRSPGTSSSPDLATLLRKARERGSIVSPKSRDQRRRNDDPPPPIPNQITSIAYAGSAPKSKNKLQRTTTNGDEKVGVSFHYPACNSNSTTQSAKSSVRSKTSAFLGKMLGSGGTVRERSVRDIRPLFASSSPPLRKQTLAPTNPPHPGIPRLCPRCPHRYTTHPLAPPSQTSSAAAPTNPSHPSWPSPPSARPATTILSLLSRGCPAVLLPSPLTSIRPRPPVSDVA